MASALDHASVLKKICGLCYKKSKNLQNITPAILDLIKNHHFVNYNVCETLPQFFVTVAAGL